MVKVKLILSLDQLEKAYKEYKKAFRFSGLFFGIHQEIMEDKDFEKYLYFSSDKVECYDIEKHKLFEIDYDDFYEVYKERYNIVKHQREIAKSEEILSLEKYSIS